MAFDKDNNGQIDFKEFEQALMELKTLNLTQEEIQRLFKDIDIDRNGKIDYTEFIAATLQRRIFLKKEVLYDAFAALDTNKNNLISKAELMKVLRLQPQQDQFVAHLIESADKNGDGDIDYKEFLEMMGYNEN